MPSTRPSQTTTLTLDDVLGRLVMRDAVTGIVVMGSAAREALSRASDYDLLVVLAGTEAPVFLVCTTVDQRFTEVYFVASTTLERFLHAAKPVTQPYTYDATLISWLQTGRIAYDRTGVLRQIREATQREQWVAAPGAREIYAACFSINYNLVQNRRMIASDDPVYLMSVDLRLLYCVHDLWRYYFQLRALPGMSEKDSIRYMMAHDQPFLDLFRRCLGETDRIRKMELYERLARATLAPAGGLWPDHATAVELADTSTARPETLEAALSFWEALII
jgi:predicted nucleotidyltransferase